MVVRSGPADSDSIVDTTRRPCGVTGGMWPPALLGSGTDGMSLPMVGGKGGAVGSVDFVRHH